MSNVYDQMRQAMNEAETQLHAADEVASQLARMLRGRLRKASSTWVRDLKRELRDFDMTTGRWKR
jgi:hypothetical protein